MSKIPQKKRVLAIDWGSVRIGIAVSDYDMVMALPRAQIEAKNQDRAIDTILTMISENNIGGIVIGDPKNMDGSIGETAGKVRGFADKLLAQFDFPIFFMDERLTSKAAESRLLGELNLSRARRRETTDQMSATILLNDFLDQAKRTCL